MRKLQPRTDWMDIGVTTLIFLIPSAILIVSIVASFAHIKDWALRHSLAGVHEWQGWAFACIVELIPIFGVLMLWKLRKARKALTVPRWILGTGFVLSMSGQIAYAGGLTQGLSRLIVAALPSVAGLVLTEVLLWLVRTVIEGDTKPVVGTSGSAPVPPPPMVIPPAPAPVSHQTSAAAVPGHNSRDTDTQPPVSPWTSPPAGRDMSPNITPDTAPDVLETSALGHGDIPQVTATVPPAHVPPTEEDVDADVPPAGQGDTSLDDPPDTGRDTEDTDGGTPDDQGDTDADVPDDDQDTDRDTSGRDRDIDPRAIEALDMRAKGMTNGKIAAHFGVSTKTVSRLIGKAAPVQAINGKTPELTTH